MTRPRVATACWLIALLLAGCALSTDKSAAPVRRDCDACPEMIELPGGVFMMGSAADQRLLDPRTGKPAKNDGPQHAVTVPSFALSRYEVTVAEFAAFQAATGHQTVERCTEFSKPDSFTFSTTTSWSAPGFPQQDTQPVVCVSFFDAVAYTRWLSSTTGLPYRLPTEAEWEYAARAGSQTPYFWGTAAARTCEFANVRSPGADTISKRQAEADAVDGFPCDDGYTQSSPAGRFKPNAFGLYDMQGNVWEWVSDCNHKDYAGAPTDGSAWQEAQCGFGIIRGGSFLNLPERSSVTVRAGRPRTGSATNMGFRVARGGTRQTVIPVAETVSAVELGSGRGAKLFRDHCAACHLRSDDFEGLYGTTREALIATVTDGGNNVMSMPAFADRLSSAEIATLADYLRNQNNWLN